jgi:hypothetical protein
VTGPNPQPTGDTAVSAPAAGWAPPVQTPGAGPSLPSSQPPAAYGPYPQQPPAPGPPRAGLGGWIVIGASAVLAIAAVTMGVIDLAKPPPAPTTTTVTAAPPAYPPDQVAAAKKESCAASLNAAHTMTAATQQYANTPNKFDSPEGQAALANAQNVVMVETTYLEMHTPPATPPEVANPTREFIKASRDVIDAYTRHVDSADASQRSQKYADEINKACG